MEKLINDVCDFIIKTVQEKSILSGFQYVVDTQIIYNEFNIKTTDELQSQIIESLLCRDDVADVVYDDGFDVVLFTDYAPNYDESNFN